MDKEKRRFVKLIAGVIPISALMLAPKAEALRLSTNTDKIDFDEGAAPANPTSDQRLYVDSADHHMKIRSSGGTVIDLSLENLNDLTEKNHSSLANVTSDQHHSQAHEATHISGGGDAFTSAQLLEAIVKRLQESGGPTTLTLGTITDGEYLKRNGATIDSGSPAGGGTLDQAYDSGGAGAGRTITADSGAVSLKTPNASVLELGDADEEGGNIDVYRDSTGIKAVAVDADSNPIMTLRSADHNDFFRLTNGTQEMNLGVNTVFGQGVTKFLKIMYGNSCGIAITDQYGDAILFFGDSEADRILIDPANRIIKGNSAVMGFQVTTSTLTLGSLGSIEAPVKTDTGAPNDAAMGNLDGCFGFNSYDSTLEARLGGAWVSVALAGYLIPKHEKMCPVCKKEMKVGQFVAGYRDKDYSDGRAHWLACHFRCALKESEKEVID